MKLFKKTETTGDIGKRMVQAAKQGKADLDAITDRPGDDDLERPPDGGRTTSRGVQGWNTNYS